MLKRLQVVILVASLLSHAAARAQSASDPAEPPRQTLTETAGAAAPAPAAPQRSAAATWGVIVVLASIAAGASLTAYGLTIDCGDDDHACHRRAALPIWGGVGVAAVGTVVGLRVIQSSSTSSAALVSIGAAF
jgi:hypothetical protein